ncbi:MAG: TolB family protein, partial [Bacteroidales bacterium]
MKKSILLMAGFIFLSVTCTFAQQDNAKLQIEDYFNIESVSSPQISPDGSVVIYGRRWVNKYDDRSQTDLWIMDANGSNNRYFMEGSNPLWSPDGSRLAFTKQGEPQGTQIFVKYMSAAGPATQVTRLDNSPSNIKWSPDGRYISFTMLVPDKDKWPVKMPEKPE